MNSSNSESGLRFVGFASRFIARIIDNVLIFLFSLLGVFLLVVIGISFVPLGALTGAGFVAVLFYPIILGIYYYIYFTGKYSTTFGKQAMNAHVCKTDETKPIGYLKSFARYIGHYVNLLTFLIGYLWIIFDKRKQGFHDKIAGTVVVFEDKKVLQASDLFLKMFVPLALLTIVFLVLTILVGMAVA